MTRQSLKLCVLTTSLLSLIALQARSAAADPPPAPASLELFGLKFCLGDVAAGTKCHIHLPATTGPKTAGAPGAHAQWSTRGWTMLPLFGASVCVGEVPVWASWLCDFGPGLDKASRLAGSRDKQPEAAGRTGS